MRDYATIRAAFDEECEAREVKDVREIKRCEKSERNARRYAEYLRKYAQSIFV